MSLVRNAVSEADRQLAFRLRYEIYVEELGRTTSGVDHVRRIVHDPLDETGHVFLAEIDGHAAGTVRINIRSEGELEHEPLYELSRFTPYYPERISMTTRLMVARSHRHAAITGQLAMAAYRQGREAGSLIDFIDTNPHLVRMYQQMGYRLYKPNIEHPEFGSVVPMVLFAGDLDYLESIRSPLVQCAREYARDTEASAFFERTFPDYASIRPTATLSEDEIWQRYCESAWMLRARRSGFLARLEPDEIRRLLCHMDPLNCAPGETIIRAGATGDGMFCLLEGQAEVRTETEKGSRIVDLLHEGDVFGEMGFVAKTRRNASVVIRQPSKVLILTDPELRRFALKEPAVAYKLLAGLFTVVVERFNARVANESS